jgi:RND superfamily putative drug exporter
MTTALEEPTRPTAAAGSDRHGTGHEAWFARLARFSARRRRRVMLTWLVVTLLAAPLALTLNSAMSGAGWEAQGSTAQKVRDELRRDFPALGAEAAVVAYHQETPIAADPSGLQTLVTALRTAPGAASVVDPLARRAHSARPRRARRRERRRPAGLRGQGHGCGGGAVAALRRDGRRHR